MTLKSRLSGLCSANCPPDIRTFGLSDTWTFGLSDIRALGHSDFRTFGPAGNPHRQHWPSAMADPTGPARPAGPAGPAGLGCPAGLAGPPGPPGHSVRPDARTCQSTAHTTVVLFGGSRNFKSTPQNFKDKGVGLTVDIGKLRHGPPRQGSICFK